MGKRPHGAVVVVDERRQAVAGVVRAADCEGQDRSPPWPPSSGTSRSCWTPACFDGSVRAAEAAPPPARPRSARAFDAMDAAGTDYAPVQQGGALAGVLTRKGALRSTLYRPAWH